MDDMLLLALCKTYDDSFEEYHFDNVEVKREVLTSGGKYIDILIEDDKYIVAIENKIFHEVDNDLQDYSRYIDKISKGREKIKILLSLYKADEQELKKQGFKNILYAELIGKIEETIGRYVLDANTKYLNYMIDFIKTLKRQERGSAMNREFIRFLSENENEINRLLVDTSEVRKEFRRKLQELSELIEIEKYGNVTQGYYRELYGELYDTLYYDIKLQEDFTIAIDTILAASGWYFDVFQRGRDSSKFEELMKRKDVNLEPSYTVGRNRLNVEYDYDESLEEIAHTLQYLIDSIAT